MKLDSIDDAIRAIKLFAHMIADAFNEGAQVWEQKLRAMSDKQADVAREMKEKQAAQAAAAAATKTVAKPASTDGGPAGLFLRPRPPGGADFISTGRRIPRRRAP